MDNDIDIEDINDDDVTSGSSFEEEGENENIHDDLPSHQFILMQKLIKWSMMWKWQSPKLSHANQMFPIGNRKLA